MILKTLGDEEHLRQGFEASVLKRDWHHALKIADELLALKRDARSVLLRARALEGLGRQVEAKGLYESVVATDPNNKIARRRLEQVVLEPIRETGCHQCKVALYSDKQRRCEKCGWLRCHRCSSCGCNYDGKFT